MKANPGQANFNAGELSPRMLARVDFQRYQVGVETLLNLIPLPEGGAMRRAGSRYVSEVSDSSVKHRLKRFQFSTTQSYILELGAETMRFYRNQGRIVVAETDASISNGTFTSNITGWDDKSTGGTGNAISHDSTNGRLSLTPNGTASDDIGWAEQDVAVGADYQAVEHTLKFEVIGSQGDRIQLRIGSSTTDDDIVADVEFFAGYHCYSFTPGTSTIYIQFRNKGDSQDKTVQIDNVSLISDAPVEIDTPYAEADLFEIEGPQSADTLYLFHNDYPTYKLTRLDDASWSLTRVRFDDGPYLDENITATTLTFSAATGFGVTVTASAVTGINGGEGFKATDVGRLIRLTDGTVNWGWAVITSVTSTTAVKADVKRTVSVTTAETKWKLGAWSGTTGYPGNGTFFEQRLWACRTIDQPQSFWASQTADFENMAPDSANASSVWDGTVEDDDAMNYTISADEVNAIRWMSPGTNLILGTTGGEWLADSDGAVLTPTDIDVKRRTKHGSAAVQPERVGDVVLFVQNGKRKVRELGFKFEVDDYRARDLTILAEHVTKSGLMETAFQANPDGLLWCVRSDGIIALLTHSLEQDIAGWGRVKMGGSFGTGDAVVESVAIIPGTNGAGQVHDSTERDEVWLIVKRTIDSATKRYIEFIERDYEDGHDQEDAFYVDCGVTYDGTATDTISGLDHLEGETVKVFADGAVHPDRTVEDGQISLQVEAEVVQVGLGYTHTFKTLKVIAGAVAGTTLAKTKQITHLGAVFLNSHVVSFGPEATNLKDVDFRQVSDAMDTAVPFFSGEKRYSFDGNVEFDPRAVFESDAPVPFTLLALAPETDTKDVL